MNLNIFTINELKISLQDFVKSKYFIILIIFFVFSLIVFLIFNFMINKNKKTINNSCKNVYFKRVYTFDTQNNIITYFNVLNPSIRKTLTYSEFYNYIEESYVDDLKKWLDSLTKGIIQEDFLCRNKNKSKFLMYFHFKKYCEDTKIIYLENFLFENLSNENISKGISSSFIDLDTLDSYFNSIKSKKKNLHQGLAIYYVKVFNDLDNNRKINSKAYYLLLKLINTLSKNIKKSQYFCFINQADLIIVDFKINKKQFAKSYASYIEKTIASLLSFEDYKNILDFRIGVVFENRIKNIDLKSKIRIASDCSLYCKNMHDENKTYFYSKNVNLNNSYHSIIVEDINRILKYQSISNTYEPIVDIKTGRIRAYLEHICFKDNNDRKRNNLYELEIYNQGKQKEYLELIINNSMRLLQESNKKAKIFTPIYFPFLLNLTAVNYKDFDNLLVFVIDDLILQSWLKTNIDAENILKTSKDRNLILALKIHDLENIKKTDILKYFNYFIYSEELMNKVKNNRFDRILLNEFILKNDQQVNIGLGVDSWSFIEMFISLGINYIAGSIIGLPSNIFENVSQKTKNTISDFNE